MPADLDLYLAARLGDGPGDEEVSGEGDRGFEFLVHVGVWLMP
jgi:hypothetical protein